MHKKLDQEEETDAYSSICDNDEEERDDADEHINIDGNEPMDNDVDLETEQTLEEEDVDEDEDEIGEEEESVNAEESLDLESLDDDGQLSTTNSNRSSLQNLNHRGSKASSKGKPTPAMTKTAKLINNKRQSAQFKPQQFSSSQSPVASNSSGPRPPMFDFTLQALEMSLYGYLRQTDPMFAGHAISGFRLPSAASGQFSPVGCNPGISPLLMATIQNATANANAKFVSPNNNNQPENRGT
jgi:hypothetical protein